MTVMYIVLVALTFTLSLLGLCIWHRHHFSYWRRADIPFIPVTPFVGNVQDLLRCRCCFGDLFRHLYDDNIAINSPFVGIFVLHNRALLIRTPELIKRILIQDFSAFTSRFETTDSLGDPMGALSLFFAKYDLWKDIHSLIAPYFNQDKVKQMYPLMQEIGKNLEAYLAKRYYESRPHQLNVEVKNVCALFTTDLLASLGFGMYAHSFENSLSKFRKMCIEVNDPSPIRILHFFVMYFFPQLVRSVNTHLYPFEFEEFTRKSIQSAIEKRIIMNFKRNDFIDMFVELMHQVEQNPEGSVVERSDFYAAQAASLVLSGFKTTSSTLTFALYELAKHEAVQSRLRRELREALRQHGGMLSYEAVNGLQYMSMVVDEVLRMYPPTAFIDRCCNATEGYSLRPWIDFTIPKGMPVYISVLGLHRDAKFWHKPNHFDPSRFKPSNRNLHHPMTYLPFGQGSRGCIGSYLGLLQVKTGLIHILKKYRIATCAQTPKELRFDPKAFILTGDGDIHLTFVLDDLQSIDNKKKRRKI